MFGTQHLTLFVISGLLLAAAFGLSALLATSTHALTGLKLAVSK